MVCMMYPSGFVKSNHPARCQYATHQAELHGPCVLRDRTSTSTHWPLTDLLLNSSRSQATCGWRSLRSSILYLSRIRTFGSPNPVIPESWFFLKESLNHVAVPKLQREYQEWLNLLQIRMLRRKGRAILGPRIGKIRSDR
jgi:hypothetical protein